ncbi:MAG: hypothetical protein ACXWU2_12360 [Allosphingosinicella sp.]
MTHQAPISGAAGAADPGRQVAQLREVLRLVEHIAGHHSDDQREELLDEAARVSDAYDLALPILQRRFDALAGEAAAWAAAGVEALLVAAESAPPRAAAARLAAQLEHALGELADLLA